MKRVFTIKNLHLLLSSFIIIPVGLVYGFSPNLLFEVNLNSIDEHNIFKAIMGLYIAFGFLFILGVFDAKFWKSATLANAFLMFGLASGRIFSLFSDGIPSTFFCFGIIGEMILGTFALYQYKKQTTT
ncbi:DUF4345 domain-containing protein [Flavobacterium aquatile]|uniref:DUF4345 domain-containing protein n=1 Tax=Flavobacterium aquatile LMG 4008 = ATCC 11947 TaxID=1453498 RepID=A0A095SUB5_9FLAO|nr:DUF4345 domain-containing protein [Flavobacterium aquatile]KGD67974.1 hypothetical protein LG45_06615 [Flavobacterium aquatile LMG 4008 = ATCC 11947]OXA65350.1 hypothetical protein B0A61_15395 [Flavobacterium aquatile LMG 4008 = ATCC 11947]GEC78910.1 hypothetical protein FAQ01_17800 [Flavobacterium aquatile]